MAPRKIAGVLSKRRWRAVIVVVCVANAIMAAWNFNKRSTIAAGFGNAAAAVCMVVAYRRALRIEREHEQEQQKVLEAIAALRQEKGPHEPKG